MKSRIIILFFSALLIVRGNAQYISLTKTEIQKLSILINTEPGAKKAYQLLEASANTALTETPRPVDTIISEGHLATDPKKINTVKSLADMRKIYALAFAYQISRKKQYLQKCKEYILAWANTNHGVGNPINDTKLDPLLEGYDLVKDKIPGKERKTIDGWLMQVADAEISAPRFRSTSKTASNNWNSHRIKVVGLIGYLLNKKEYKEFTDTSLRKQILNNLYPDGSGMDFEERDALHYHTYTLEPLLKIATVIKRAGGLDYYTYTSPSGSSIQKSVLFLQPFATGEKLHPEFVNSKVSFDKKRADNKEPGYTIGANFEPGTAVEALSYAAYFDPANAEIVKKLLHTTDAYANWQMILNEARK